MRDSRLICTVNEVQGAEVRLTGGNSKAYICFKGPCSLSDSRGSELRTFELRSEVRFGPQFVDVDVVNLRAPLPPLGPAGHPTSVDSAARRGALPHFFRPYLAKDSTTSVL
jgi:hypothetical protein